MAYKSSLISSSQKCSNRLPMEKHVHRENDVHARKTHRSGGRSAYNKVVKSYNKTFSMYAEIDVDQPTNYSIRYAEDDSDSEQPEFSQDTVKTYCTENTPYETPFSLSSAPSISDLKLMDKIDDADEPDDDEHVNEQSSTSNNNNDNNNSNSTNLKSTCPVNITGKTSYNSGLMSPENPVNYCEEGTPGVFSSFGSLGSMNSLPMEAKIEVPKIVSAIKDKDGPTTKGHSNELKAVKFEEVVNYVEDTPLMFSRCSSLASLDSVEAEHSIHDDRSSIISDFSRLTSGLISPSEIPDSPTQTIPCSPNSKRKTHNTNTSRFNVKTIKIKDEPPVTTIGKDEIFADTVTNFVTESTPIEFSTTTSLSNLSIEDFEQSAKKDNTVDVVDGDLSSDDDENMLAACITMGMKSNRYNHTECLNTSVDDSIINEENQSLSNAEEEKVTSDNSVSDSQQSLNEINLESKCQKPGSEDTKNDTTSETNECTELLEVGDCDSLSSDNESDNALLERCINAGKFGGSSNLATKNEDHINDHNTTIPTSPESNTYPVEDLTAIKREHITKTLLIEKEPLPCHSDEEDDVNEEEENLLQKCILAGMPKIQSTVVEDLDENDELTENEKRLLHQCILDGVPKHKPVQCNTEINQELSDLEEKLLTKCILNGMPKKCRHLINL